MPAGPLPLAAQRRPTLLIVGCGDVGLRVLRRVSPAWRVVALTSSPARRADLRAAGALPLLGNLDDVRTLYRLAPLADVVLHLAPPPNTGDVDARSAHLARALARAGRVRRLVYMSTTGVYGDAQGARFDETRPVAPATARARRRVDAEGLWRTWGRRHAVAVTILRVPGIYGLDRAGGDPRDRVRRGTPVLLPEDDVYTNHVHADDLARVCVAALFRGRPQRVVHASDDTELSMGDHYDLVADLAGLPRPPRISRAEAPARLGEATMSFLSESRRLVNRRLKDELRVVLQYPTVRDALLPASRG